MDKIGIVDTTFARFDMGQIAEQELKNLEGYSKKFELIRRTVPGFKDLAVECKLLIEQEACKIVLALAMPGAAELDRLCAHEASQGLMLAQLMTNTHILEVFVHESEESDPNKLIEVCINRTQKHARNAYFMLYSPQELTKQAGQGIRQGYPNAGALNNPQSQK